MENGHEYECVLTSTVSEAWLGVRRSWGSSVSCPKLSQVVCLGCFLLLILPLPFPRRNSLGVRSPQA